MTETSTAGIVDTAVIGAPETSGEVATVKPAGFPYRVSHPETGYSGLDFVPKELDQLEGTRKIKSAPVSARVIVARSGADFTPREQSNVRDKVLEAKIVSVAKELQEQKKGAVAAYKAMLKRKDDPDLSDEERETIRKKIAKGNPMSPQRARKLAEEAVLKGLS